MKLSNILGAAALSLAITGAASAQSLGVEPGNWETSHTFTGTVKTQGMSMELPGKTNTTTQCISEEDATFDPDELSGDGCTASNIQSTGKSVSFDLTCDQGGASMEGTMEATASDDGRSVTGTMTITGSQPGGGSIDMKGDFSGKRLGACS
ncbi:DUF3617 domain-containing protein [Henriciella aquimarina]|uniref:DUF3617 domain-containing protein n=1 Tax=Henriciella aquimarina TaxID=545261 RepID=UPI000A00AAFE|nr:DUF3617 domain-containing protein [Henriciella aquimarina]